MKLINKTLKNKIIIVLAILFLIGTASATSVNIPNATKNVLIGDSADFDIVLNVEISPIPAGVLPWDANHDGTIQKSEAIAAVVAYFGEVITKAQAIQVVVSYFNTALVNGDLSWEVMNASPYPVSAKINSQEFNNVGVVHITSALGNNQIHKLTIKPQSGVVVGNNYDVYVSYCEDSVCIGDTATVHVIGTPIPTPEPNTLVFTTMGLIGLVGLVKFSKRN